MNAKMATTIKEIKFVDAVSANTITLASKTSQCYSLPTPESSQISGYTMAGCVQAWINGSAYIMQAGFLGVEPGADVYFYNFGTASESGIISARYLYYKK